MILKRFVSITAVVFLFTCMFLVNQVSAQTGGNGWSGLLELSTGRGKASEATTVTDVYGYSHFFWTEELPDASILIFYTRFDGSSWSPPIDIFVIEPNHDIGNLSAAVTGAGMMVLVWTDTTVHSTFLASAPANNAMSARNWSTAANLNIPAGSANLRIDPAGNFHMVYTEIEKEVGVYYTHSEDQGLTWSKRVWLDPGIRQIYTPSSINFQLDKFGGLHLVWNYETAEQVGEDQVCYMQSLDGGITWSKPVIIDSSIAQSGSLDFASPVMAIHEKTILVIWAGGEFPYRNYVYSRDAGQTWTPPFRIFGDLHGQAFDGLAVDSSGRFHYFAQIRYPMGIYHAIWDQEQWTTPALIYLIGEASDVKKSEGEIDPASASSVVPAHYTYPIIRAGNQIILTFTDNPSHPNRRLFAMVRSLDGVTQITPLPVPDSTNQPVELPTPSPMVESLLSEQGDAVPEQALVESSTRKGLAGNGLWFGIIPVALLVGSTLLVKLISRLKN